MRRMALIFAVLAMAGALFVVAIASRKAAAGNSAPGPESAAPTPAASAVTNGSSLTDQWEYLVVTGASNVNFSPSGSSSMRKDRSGAFVREGFVLEQNMDKLGAKGWELVSVSGPPNEPIYYFKRPKQGGDGSSER